MILKPGNIQFHGAWRISELDGASGLIAHFITIMAYGCLKQCFCLVIKICEHWRPGETQSAENSKNKGQRPSRVDLKASKRTVDSQSHPDTPHSTIEEIQLRAHHSFILKRYFNMKLRAQSSSVEWYHPTCGKILYTVYNSTNIT